MPPTRVPLALLTALALALPLAAFPEPAADDQQESREKVAALRKDPRQYDRLRRLEDSVRTFLARPQEEQDRIRKLDRDVHRQSPVARDRLLEMTRRYADWLENLPEEERRSVVDAPDRKARLDRVRALREEEWVARQPRAVRDRLRKLKEAAPAHQAARDGLGAARALLLGTRAGGAFAAASAPLYLPGKNPHDRLLAKLRQTDRERRLEWQLAVRHWDTLLGRPGKELLPARLADFDPEVVTFVREYLRPVLSDADRERLDRAEGEWPRFPRTLVALADRHPMALLPQHGPRAFKELPAEVQKEFERALRKPKTGAFQIPPQLRNAEDNWPLFVLAAAKYVADHNAKVKPKFTIRLKYDLWPARPDDLSAGLRAFVKGQLLPRLNADEAALLRSKEGKWPEYPHTIQELATRHYLHVPWQTLPGPRERWDAYRLRPQAGAAGFPELPPVDRTALRLADDGD